VLFVDDNSQDGTRGVIAELQQAAPDRVFLLPRAGKLGLGTAYVAAFKWGLARGYDVFVEMDADLSHRPEDLAKILQVVPNSPVVIGSRYIAGGGTQNWSIFRRMISVGGSFYARTILGLKARDLTGGFNAWHRQVLLAINPDHIRSEGYTFQVELKFRAHLAGFNLREVPILFVERRAGQSKMSGGIVTEAMYRIWLLAAQRVNIRRELATRTGL
jgi:dolichol-phosphate mannosyltransferase